MPTPASHPRHAPPAPWPRWALATAAALALHAALLGGLPDLSMGTGAANQAPAAGAAPLLVRQLVVPQRLQPAPAPAPKAATAAPEPVRTQAAAPLPLAAAAAAAPAAAASSAAAPDSAASAAEIAQPAPTEDAVTTAAAPAIAAAPDAPAAPPPLYRTQPAPAATLLFDLKRGLAGGQAVLQWRPESAAAAGPSSYTLTLHAQAFGINVAAWNSSGRFDAAGLAPDRYAESRRSREVRATNFQRAADKISFSAQAAEFPLPAGVQDRSSWMLQLGAILQAQPELAAAGAQVSLWVVGTRGAPEPWVFTVQQRAPLALGSGDAASTVADAVHLVREPRRPYDTRASVWLDPARHHLPLKVQMLVQASGEGQEFELRQLTLP